MTAPRNETAEQRQVRLAKQRAYGRRWYAENREAVRTRKNTPEIRARIRANHRRRLYGMTQEEYAALLQKQDFKCAVCGSEDTGRHDMTHLAVDHCHATGRIRGLLCTKCNTGIGGLRDSSELLRKAASYIEQHKLSD